MQKTWFNPWVGKIPWRRELLCTPVFLPVEFHGQRSPVSWTWLSDFHFLSYTFTMNYFYIIYLSYLLLKLSGWIWNLISLLCGSGNSSERWTDALMLLVESGWGRFSGQEFHSLPAIQQVAVMLTVCCICQTREPDGPEFECWLLAFVSSVFLGKLLWFLQSFRVLWKTEIVLPTF